MYKIYVVMLSATQNSTYGYTVKKLSADIKTYRGAGYTYDKPSERRSAEYHSGGKKRIKDVLEDYLTEYHGLPALTAGTAEDYDSEDEEEEEEE